MCECIVTRRCMVCTSLFTLEGSLPYSFPLLHFYVLVHLPTRLYVQKSGARQPTEIFEFSPLIFKICETVAEVPVVDVQTHAGAANAEISQSDLCLRAGHSRVEGI